MAFILFPRVRASMERWHINPAALKDAQSIGYNHGIIANGTFYMAGQVAMDADSNIVGDDIHTQATKAYENVGILLETVGKGFADVTKVTTYIIDPHARYYEGYKDVYWEVFEVPYPCHTVLGVDQLAHEDYLLEIEIDVPITEEDIAALEPDGEEVVKIS